MVPQNTAIILTKTFYVIRKIFKSPKMFYHYGVVSVIIFKEIAYYYRMKRKWAHRGNKGGEICSLPLSVYFCMFKYFFEISKMAIGVCMVLITLFI
jgi:hypothetical protein